MQRTMIPNDTDEWLSGGVLGSATITAALAGKKGRNNVQVWRWAVGHSTSYPNIAFTSASAPLKYLI